MALKDDVVAKVTEKLSQLSPSQIDEYVSRGEEHFLTITKRLEVPPRALWLWVDLSIAFYNDSLGASGDVTSIRITSYNVCYTKLLRGLIRLMAKTIKSLALKLYSSNGS